MTFICYFRGSIPQIIECHCCYLKRENLIDCSNCRGNATIRQTAKKAIVQEPDASVSLDMGTAKVPRPSKSKARRLIGRLIRVLQSLIVIAAVNVPLYMMLLFKDWIDR